MINQFKPVEMLALNLNAHLFPLMSINPLISAHFVMKMNTHASCAKNGYLLGNSCFQCRKDRRQVKSCSAQGMLQGKINHEQIGHRGFPKLNPQAYIV